MKDLIVFPLLHNSDIALFEMIKIFIFDLFGVCKQKRIFAQIILFVFYRHTMAIAL